MMCFVFTWATQAAESLHRDSLSSYSVCNSLQSDCLTAVCPNAGICIIFSYFYTNRTVNTKSSNSLFHNLFLQVHVLRISTLLASDKNDSVGFQPSKHTNYQRAGGGTKKTTKSHPQILQPLDTYAQPPFFLPHFKRKDVSGFQGNAIAAIY